MRESRIALYPLDVMYKIGNGDVEKLDYDFSVIPNDQYTRFFNSLPNIIYKKCKKIKLSCTFEYDYSRRKQKTGKSVSKKENVIANSIATNRPRFVQYLTKILVRVLPSSKLLKKLNISYMKLKDDNFSDLIQAILKNKSLTSIHFKYTTFTDVHCIALLKGISPYRYVNISFKNCDITSKSYNAFIEFLNRPPTNTQIDRQIQSIKLNGAQMTAIEIDNIDYLLYGDEEEEQQSVNQITEDITTDIEKDFDNPSRTKHNTNNIEQQPQQQQQEYEYEYYEESTNEAQPVTDDPEVVEENGVEEQEVKEQPLNQQEDNSGDDEPATITQSVIRDEGNNNMEYEYTYEENE